MTHAPSPANYEYIHAKLAERYGDTLPFIRILDFGCGEGGMVEYLQGKGLNVVGADPYQSIYAGWENTGKPHLHKITDRRLPFGDEMFDCVISNQVFEHIDGYKPELQEVKRVLKPGGYFLALFPALETAYEVHSGIWFAYYLKFFPPLLQTWLYFWRLVGAGLWKENHTPDEWSANMRDIIVKECHYRPALAIIGDWQEAFGHKPRTRMADYLSFRLARTRLAALAGLPAFLLTLPSLARAGIVIDITK